MKASAARAMVGWSLGLFFLPFLNGFVGGSIGAQRMGSFRAALRNEVVPVLAWGTLIALGIGFLLTPLAGYHALWPAVWMFLTAAGIVAGAALGGAFAKAAHVPPHPGVRGFPGDEGRVHHVPLGSGAARWTKPKPWDRPDLPAPPEDRTPLA